MQALTAESPHRAEMVEHALDIVRRFPRARVFPIRAGSKFPPLISAWPTEASNDTAKIRAWWGRSPSANIGVTGLVVFDIDVRDGKPGVASFASLGLSQDEVAATLIVTTPSGGTHIYFQQPDGEIISSRNGFRPGLDLKADGGYVLGPGSRLDGFERRYEITQDRTPGPCPETLLVYIRAGASKQNCPDRDCLAPGAVLNDPVMIQQATAWLRIEAPTAIEGQLGDNTTFQVACELHDLGLSERTAFDLMEEHYNPRCDPPWEPEDLRAKVLSAWRSAQNRIGTKHPEAVSVALRADFAGVVDLPPYRERQTALERRLMRQGDPLPRRTWLLKNLLPRTGTALLVAPTGAGKSSVAGQLARSLATGESFFGREVKERCGTLILAAEGAGGLQARLNVLSANGGLPIYALKLASLNGEAAFNSTLADVEEVAALCLAEHGLRLGLVILDTLAASGLITNENDNSECAAAIKKLGRLSLELDCLVMSTHHSPKVGTDPRGGSALGAGVDLILTVTRYGQAKVRGIQCTKGRDSPEGTLGSFTLLVETVGMDEDGDVITACAVSMSDAPSEVAATPIRMMPTPAQTEEIRDRIEEGAPDGAPWRFAYSSHDDGDNWAGVPIGEVMGFVAQGSDERPEAKAILNDMMRAGALAKGDRKDPLAPKNSQRKPVPFVKVP